MLSRGLLSEDISSVQQTFNISGFSALFRVVCTYLMSHIFVMSITGTISRDVLRGLLKG